jgi:hypothetical protein
LSTDEDDDYYSHSEDDKKNERVVCKDLNLFDYYTKNKHKPIEVDVSDGDDYIYSDIDNFIVNSEDEREERRIEKRLKKQLQEVSKKKSRSPRDNDNEKRSSSGKRRRIVIDDDDDEEEEFDDDYEDGEDDDDDEDCDSEEDDEDINGSLQYWQLNAMMDEKKDKASYCLPISYNRTEAMKIYIELLGNVHVNEKFLSNLAKDSYSEDSIKYYAALKQIENLICINVIYLPFYFYYINIILSLITPQVQVEKV